MLSISITITAFSCYSLLAVLRYSQGFSYPFDAEFRSLFNHYFKFFFFSQFVFVSSILRSRFKALNDHLAKTKMKENPAKLRYGEVFNLLSDGIEIVNSTFTFHFVLLFATFFVRKLRKCFKFLKQPKHF
jgi:hypothetical protein